KRLGRRPGTRLVPLTTRRRALLTFLVGALHPPTSGIRTDARYLLVTHLLHDVERAIEESTGWTQIQHGPSPPNDSFHVEECTQLLWPSRRRIHMSCGKRKSWDDI